jgi:hypothetical protein
MVKHKHKKTKDFHVAIFGTIFAIILMFITFGLAQSVSTDPQNTIIHTSLMYYDSQFSESNINVDTNTALYVLNQSNEHITASVYEYDKNYKEVNTLIDIGPRENKYLKPSGSAVVYLSNYNNSARSIIKFSRWYFYKKYPLPSNFNL